MSQQQNSDWARSVRGPEVFARERAALGQDDNDWIRCSLGGRSVFVQRFGTTIRGFENVCRHRFYPIRTANKGSELIRCAFHHWVYNQDGSNPFGFAYSAIWLAAWKPASPSFSARNVRVPPVAPRLKVAAPLARKAVGVTNAAGAR